MKYMSAISIFLSLFFAAGPVVGITDWPVYQQNPFRIPLAKEQHIVSERGGIIVGDLNGDGLMDFVLSTMENERGPGRASLAAYDHDGEILWVDGNADIVLTSQAEYDGLPGNSGPGVSAIDTDGDGLFEIIYLSSQNEIVIRNGKTGKFVKKIPVSMPEESTLGIIGGALQEWLSGSAKKAVKYLIRRPNRWSHFQIVNLKGKLDDEIILQADPLPFRWLKAVSIISGETIWERHDYVGLQHGGFRAADIDGDGYDEVVGNTMIEEDGSLNRNWKYRRYPGHFDALQIADIRPDARGLEWVVLEEGHFNDDRTTILGRERIFFSHSFRGWEPQSVVIGEFDLRRIGLELWCQSRFELDQKPWVIDARGETIASYHMDDLKPVDWSKNGVEFSSPIDWTGSPRQLIATKERWKNGKIGIFDPLTGKFLHSWDEAVSRLYVVDVAGDSREEIVVVNVENYEIRVYWNEDDNTFPRKPRNWSRNEYTRSKINYNFYSQ